MEHDFHTSVVAAMYIVRCWRLCWNRYTFTSDQSLLVVEQLSSKLCVVNHVGKCSRKVDRLCSFSRVLRAEHIE